MNPSNSDPRPPRRRRAGMTFVWCGVAFLGVGLGAHQTPFLAIGPAFIAMGIAFLVRERKRTPRN